MNHYEIKVIRHDSTIVQAVDETEAKRKLVEVFGSASIVSIESVTEVPSMTAPDPLEGVTDNSVVSP